MASSGANAAPGISPKLNPRVYCELAKDLGYPSRGYVQHTGGCSSAMRPVTPTPGRNGLTNNLAYYVVGEGEGAVRIRRVSLILNVNNVREKRGAHSELVRVAAAIAEKLAGEVPKGFTDTVSNAGSRRWTQGQWEIEVKTEVWPIGLGQDTQVYFRPRR